MAVKKISVRNAVIVYNALRNVNAAKLPDTSKTDLIAIIRATRVFKAIADAQLEYEKDAAERLKPADFEDLMSKRGDFNSLTAEEQKDVTRKLMAYDQAFMECIKPELDKEVDLADFEPLSESALAGIASASDNMAVETLLLIEDMCC